MLSNKPKDAARITTLLCHGEDAERGRLSQCRALLVLEADSQEEQLVYIALISNCSSTATLYRGRNIGSDLLVQIFIASLLCSALNSTLVSSTDSHIGICTLGCCFTFVQFIRISLPCCTSTVQRNTYKTLHHKMSLMKWCNRWCIRMAFVPFHQPFSISVLRHILVLQMIRRCAAGV